MKKTNLPKGWEIKKLKDICQIRPPKKEVKDKLDEKDIVSFLPMKDLGVCEKSVTAYEERVLKDVVGSYTYFADNDVLLAKITPCFENGKLGIAKNLMNGVGFGSSEYIVLRSKAELSSEYLFYFLSRESFRDEGERHMGGAVGHKRVPNNFIENVEIPLPPLPEQQRIVSILDHCFEAIDKAKANAEQNLRNAKELFESYLQGVFEKRGEGWEEKSLKKLTTKIGSGATPRGGQASYKTEGISLVRSMNVYDGEFRDDRLAFIDDNQAKALNGVTLKEDDVLLNITGGSLARCCIIPKEYLPGRVNQHVSILRPKRGVLDSRFLNLLLISKPYKDQILSIGEQGSTRQAITKAQIEAFTIPLLPLEEQQSIVHKLDVLRIETEKLEVHYQKKIDDLEELKKSILQKAFAGELKTDKMVEEFA